ncbi:MAG: hypothetical protein M0P71_02180 [Melioribacteraceae bacterium]|nr:hypothetical protein [Melioribacteraceae bacterium]
MKIDKGHTFHIPVLGIGYSADTPAKVAKYGISSVISLVDDTLLEHLRKMYQENNEEPYTPIPVKDEDSRAKRITAYLNTINKTVKEQFERLKNSKFDIESELTKYFEMLPDLSELKEKYNQMLIARGKRKEKLQNWLRENIFHGSIDVNIMTKLDKTNYSTDNIELPQQFNDAHAALRGFANSELESSIIFSAGMNPRLYNYLETLKEFLPSSDGSFKKKIVIKVSDFRSAFIQGKYLAKKGLWVSEFRIESGLNCGGHAFASDGFLLGPILQEFKNRKEELFNSIKELFIPAIANKEITINDSNLNIDITVQGGIGKSSEHDFLIRYFGVKSVGWGSPFLLVPETMNVDTDTLERLSCASEDDLYLSDISPLGVPFNSLKGNTKDLEKMDRLINGKPGSPCPKKFLVSNKDYSDKPLCPASITFMKKISELKNADPDSQELNDKFNWAAEKSCLCEGLSATVYKSNNIQAPKGSNTVSVCPGPNLAYFSKISTLKEMVDHIYGRINLITNSERPNLFIKEIQLYIDYMHKRVSEEKLFNTFRNNIIDGIKYYRELLPEIKEETEKVRERIREELDLLEQKLSSISVVAA